MKKAIHPQYYPDAKVICACGNTFVTGSTIPEIRTEICSNCHPFFTGKQKLVDNQGRVERFKQLLQKRSTMKSAAKPARHAVGAGGHSGK